MIWGKIVIGFEGTVLTLGRLSENLKPLKDVGKTCVHVHSDDAVCLTVKLTAKPQFVIQLRDPILVSFFIWQLMKQQQKLRKRRLRYFHRSSITWTKESDIRFLYKRSCMMRARTRLFLTTRQNCSHWAYLLKWDKWSAHFNVGNVMGM